MWATGRAPGSSSSVATRRMIFGWLCRSAIRCDPQDEQKYRNLPGEDSNDERRSWPLVHLKCSRLTHAVGANGAAWAFRQEWQWQWPIGPSNWSASYWTAPHRQLPFMPLNLPAKIAGLPASSCCAYYWCFWIVVPRISYRSAAGSVDSRHRDGRWDSVGALTRAARNATMIQTDWIAPLALSRGIAGEGLKDSRTPQLPSRAGVGFPLLFEVEMAGVEFGVVEFFWGEVFEGVDRVDQGVGGLLHFFGRQPGRRRIVLRVVF
jgi:hypothetical protein